MGSACASHAGDGALAIADFYGCAHPRVVFTHGISARRQNVVAAATAPLTCCRARVVAHSSVSKFQFGGLPAVALAKADEFVHV